VSNDAYELVLARPARQAIADKLPPAVAEAAVEFITGPLLENPRRVGKSLREPLAGVYSARFGTNWRVLYEIDDVTNIITVLDIRARSEAYKQR